MQQYEAGTLAEAGSYCCDRCGYKISITSPDKLPGCCGCGCTSFTRASMFVEPSDFPTVALEPEANYEEISESMQKLGPGRYVAFELAGRSNIVPLKEEITHIGRSVSADLILDDPTVSRRHAMVIVQDERTITLDDRSLNGVYVNGERVERCRLSSGDEIVIGRFKLLYLEKELTVHAMPGLEGDRHTVVAAH